MIFFRDSDRVAICGDVIRNITYLSLRSRLATPPDNLTPDPAENRRSIRKLAELDPSLILPGHGPEVTDIERLQALGRGAACVGSPGRSSIAQAGPRLHRVEFVT